MKFKTKVISTAVVAAFGTAAGTAQAVNLGADLQGQVLLYPYYTAQTKGSTAIDTYITVVNSDSVNGKAVKVRVLEAKNSREVIDFNLYLSPNDVWTAVITRDAANNGLLRTWDNSCTVPLIGSGVGGPRDVGFVNYAYADANSDGLEGDLSRTREGYVEIIEMADLGPVTVTAGNFNTFAAAKHNAAGVPANCAGIVATWGAGGYAGPTDGVLTPTGGLSGTGTLINPLEGTDLGYSAIALDNFSNVANHQAPGSVLPNLTQVSPKISDVFDGARLVRTNWTADIALAPPANLSGVAPVSATIMRNTVQNEYAVMAAPVGLGTDWLVTFPTKAQHLGNHPSSVKPFTDPFVYGVPPIDNFPKLPTTGACESITLSAYDREEQGQVGLNFSPPKPGGAKLCWEANVVRLNGPGGAPASNVLGGVLTVNNLSMPAAAGWLKMAFANTMVSTAGASTAYPLGGAVAALANPVTYSGLPVVGFMAQSFLNTTSLAAYGEAYAHRYTRVITP